MGMKVIEKNGMVLARHISTTDLAEGLSFYSKDEEYIQVGSWRYNQGKELLAHIHNEVKREVLRTQEVLLVTQGKVKACIYDLQERLAEEIVVQAGEILVLLQGAHGYTILEDDTRVIEIKNGPYLGADVDRRRI